MGRRSEQSGMSAGAYARAAGLGRRTVYDWVESGRIAHTRVGGRILITEAPPTPVALGDDVGQSRGMTVSEYAAACQVTDTTVYRWAQSGRIESDLVGGLTVITSPPERPGRLPFDPGRGMSAEAFAASRGVRTETVYRWARNGQVESERVGDRVVVLADLDQPISAARPSGHQVVPRGYAPPGHVAVAQFAARHGVSYETVQRWARIGWIPSIRKGRRVYIPDGAAPSLSPAPCDTPGMTTAQFATACGVSPRAVRGWIRRGMVQTVSVGRRRYITSDPDPGLSGRREVELDRGMTTAQFAAATGVSPDRVRRWARSGAVDSELVGSRVVILTDPDGFTRPGRRRS